MRVKRLLWFAMLFVNSAYIRRPCKRRLVVVERNTTGSSTSQRVHESAAEVEREMQFIRSKMIRWKGQHKRLLVWKGQHKRFYVKI